MDKNIDKRNARMDNLLKAQEEIAKSTKGRKSLVDSGKSKRAPFTTSITDANREKLGMLAVKNRIRVADLLDEILNEYFSKNEI